ncbi:MAG TPA: acyl-CoA dehydrogenase [Planctomycetota bacterium]
MSLAGLRERARALGERLGPSVAQKDEEAAALAAVAALAQENLLAWTVPARDGGAPTEGLCSADTVSVRALVALRDELAYHSGMLDVMLVMQGLGSFAVALGGPERLRREVLPEVAAGRAIAAFALTEPGAGSSLADVATRAERRGERWVLDGHKTFISNAPIARFFTLLARTAPAGEKGGGLSMFFVPSDAWGLDVQPFEVLGPHPIGDVILKGCELPAEFLLGREGQGLELALATLGRFRTSVAAAANGFARRALDESCAHLGTRVQGGKPLARHQALRFDLAEMDVRLRAAQLLVDEAAARVDAGADATAAVARAKLFATESAGWICDRAVQLHGGLGVKRGSVVERLYRDVRALRIYEGTSEIQKGILARALLGE